MPYQNHLLAQIVTENKIAFNTNPPNTVRAESQENTKGVSYPEGVFYGVSPKGGDHDGGVIFVYNPQNQEVLNVYNFKNSMDEDQENGILPVGRFLKASNGKLYGVTTDGGDPYGTQTGGYGILYSFDTAGNVFTKLHDFKLETGALPYSPLMQASNGKIYGTYTSGGPGNATGIYSFDIASGTYTPEHSFSIFEGSPRGILTEAVPGKLFGTLLPERFTNDGRVFVFDINTVEVEIIYTFSNSDPKTPDELIDGGDGKIYAVSGDELFSINTSTFQYNTEYKFEVVAQGLLPFEAITLGSNGKIYGTTRTGGERGFGTVFSFDPSSKLYNALYSGYNMDEFFHGSRLVENVSKSMYGMMGKEFANENGAIFYFTMEGPFVYDVLAGLPGGNYAGPGGSITWLPPTECIKPTPLATNSGPVCVGEELTLFAAPADNYIWKGPNNFTSSLRNPVIKSITQDLAGSYEVLMYNGVNCFSSAITTVIVNALPVVEISNGGPLSFCEKDSVILTASGEGSYLWSNQATTKAITATQSGQYFVALTNLQSCTGFSDTISVSVFDSPLKPGITWNGAELSTNAGYAKYNWYLNGVLLSNGSTNKIVPQQPGNYTVTIYNSNNCTAQSDSYNLELYAAGLRVGTTIIYSYPNPVRDRLNIYRKNDLQKVIRIRITDLKGIVLVEQSITGTPGSIVLTNLPAGVYTATLDDGKRRSSFQFIKTQ